MVRGVRRKARRQWVCRHRPRRRRLQAPAFVHRGRGVRARAERRRGHMQQREATATVAGRSDGRGCNTGLGGRAGLDGRLVARAAFASAVGGAGPSWRGVPRAISASAVGVADVYSCPPSTWASGSGRGRPSGAMPRAAHAVRAWVAQAAAPPRRGSAPPAGSSAPPRGGSSGSSSSARPRHRGDRQVAHAGIRSWRSAASVVAPVHAHVRHAARAEPALQLRQVAVEQRHVRRR